MLEVERGCAFRDLCVLGYQIIVVPIRGSLFGITIHSRISNIALYIYRNMVVMYVTSVIFGLSSQAIW